MIGHFYTVNGNPVKKPPINLHKNFYRAISEAQQFCKGRAIVINENQKWALVGNETNKPIRILVTRG